MSAYTAKCSRCGGTISHVDAPDLPEGYVGGAWEGYFHLDPQREHFGGVGWRQLQPAPAKDLAKK